MILVTGAAGYIASHFLRRYLLAAEQNKVVGVDNLSTGHLEALPDDPRFVFYHEDIGNFEQMKAILHKHSVESVVHFAANCYVGESEKEPFKYFNNNVVSTMRLLEAMAEQKVHKLVFSSSCASYGTPQFLPLTELHRQQPINTYGQTKLMVEGVLESLKRSIGLNFIALRYFNAAGADDSFEIGESHEPETHLIPNVLRALNGKIEYLEVYGDDYQTRDGTCIRDYVHVNDLADAHISALELLHKTDCGFGINLGTGYGASIKEIIQIASELFGKEIKTKILPRRPGDPAVLVADYAKAKEILSWSPKYDLASIIKTAWNWELNRRY